MKSLPECIPWMAVGLAESVAIVTLNLCTILVFIRNRNLRRRGTYLMINLAVIDMFVAGAAVNYLFYRYGKDCDLWERDLIEDGAYNFLQILLRFFVVGSILNITIIALERVHATFRPLRHRVLKKWVYRLIIAVVWVTSGLLSVSFRLLARFDETQDDSVTLCITFASICLLIICASYTSIIVKARCGAQPQHHGAASRERKLTTTLFIVTVVSLLLYLPHITLRYVVYISKHEIWWLLPHSVRVHLESAFLVLFYANSFVNPILYAIRMPEYRSAFLALFRKRPRQLRQVVVLSLRGLRDM